MVIQKKFLWNKWGKKGWEGESKNWKNGVRSFMHDPWIHRICCCYLLTPKVDIKVSLLSDKYLALLMQTP